MPDVLKAMEQAGMARRGESRGSFDEWLARVHPDDRTRVRDIALRCAYMVPTGGLVRQADELHLVTDAQRRLGMVMARAMMALQADGCGR